MRLLRQILVLVVAISLATALAVPRESHAMSKKVVMMYKAAGYGAAAGLLVGAATWTMGFGTAKNMMIGTSLGLYSGIIFGVVILMTQTDKSGQMRRENPYKPGKPIGPDDWENEPEDTLRTRSQNAVPVDPGVRLAVWVPVYGFSF